MLRERVFSHVDEVRIHLGSVVLIGDPRIPYDQKTIVLFAHGSGCSRHSRRNQHLANVLQEAVLATLLLLTQEEEAIDQYMAHLRFDISLLADRLIDVSDWVAEKRALIGYRSATSAQAPAAEQQASIT